MTHGLICLPNWAYGHVLARCGGSRVGDLTHLAMKVWRLCCLMMARRPLQYICHHGGRQGHAGHAAHSGDQDVGMYAALSRAPLRTTPVCLSGARAYPAFMHSLCTSHRPVGAGRARYMTWREKLPLTNPFLFVADFESSSAAARRVASA